MTKFEALPTLITNCHDEFGKRVNEKTIHQTFIGRSLKYLVLRPITLISFWNADGFTTTLDEFEGIFGYGDTIAEAQSEVLGHIEALRTQFSNLTVENATPDARLFGEKLNGFLTVLPA